MTGAQGGIGRAIVKALVDEGVEVVAHDVRTDDLRRSTQVTTVTSDLLSSSGLAALRTVLDEGSLNWVIAAHGVEGSDAIADLSRDRIERVLRVNFVSITRLFAMLRTRLGDSRGVFLVVASEAGLQGEANASTYCASKFAVIGWARATARAFNGVRIRVICPGPTNTELLQGGMRRMAHAEGISAADLAARRASQIPVARFAETSEIAASVVCLAKLELPSPVLCAVTGGEVLH